MKLQDIHIVFICPDHNEKYNKRRIHMETLLKNLGCKYVRHYKSGTENYPACLTSATIDILESNMDVPVLILEDDVEFTGIDLFDFIEDADAIYFGLSNCGGHISENSNGGSSKFGPYSTTQLRVLNMLSTHAVLYISPRYKKAVIDCFDQYKKTNYFNDVLLSRLQSKFKILANKKPSFYQSAKFNDGLHVQNCTKIELDSMLHIQTAVVNNPTFIEFQVHTLKYFVKGDYTFTVYNDAKRFPDYSNFGDPNVRRRIEDTCSKLNIPCISIENNHHIKSQSASRRTADALNIMLDAQRKTQDRFRILDADMFPIMPFDTKKYRAYDAAILPQIKTTKGKSLDYFWNGIAYFDMATLNPKEIMNWNDEWVEDVFTDTGGGMYYFLKETKNKFYRIPYLQSLTWSSLDWPLDVDTRWLQYAHNDDRNKDGKYFTELYDNTFFHFRAGGNWEKYSADMYERRVKPLTKLIYNVCRNE